MPARLATTAAVLLAVAGCNDVFGLDPPRVDGGGGGGGDGGGPLPDGPRAPCTFEDDAFVVPAYWWVPDGALMTAVRYHDNGVEYGFASGKTAAQLAPRDYRPATVGPPATHSQLEYPALSADGNRLVVRMERTSGGYDLGIGGRLDQQFASPQVVVLQDEVEAPIVLSIQHRPSAPTATNPSRMLLTSPSSLDELEEGVAGGTWKRVHQDTPFELGLFAVGSGNLSADGLSVVFAGIPAMGAQPRIYYMHRTSLDAPFTMPGELYRAPLAVTPYVSNDCTSLFFVSGTDVRSAY